MTIDLTTSAVATELPDSPPAYLFKTSNDATWHPEIVVICGNGAVHDAGPALRKTLNNFKVQNKYQAAEIADPTLVIAETSFKLRFVRNSLLPRLIRLYENEKRRLIKGDIPPKYIEAINEVHTLRGDLAANLLNAQNDGTLTARSLNCLSPGDLQKTGIICLNWDKCIFDAFPNVIQLHGSVDNQKSLILPSELNTDEACWDLVRENVREILDDEAFQIVHDAFRGEALADVQSVHRKTSSWLGNAKTLVFWGIALNCYDAEVLAVLATYPGELVENIYVINPDERAVAAAVATIRPKLPLNIVWVPIDKETGKPNEPIAWNIDTYLQGQNPIS